MADKYERMKEELGREFYAEEIADITNIFASIPRLTDIQADIYNYIDESDQRKAEGRRILWQENELTDKETNDIIDDILYTQKGLERQVKRLKFNIKNNKYKDDPDQGAIKSIILIEQGRNIINNNKIQILTHYLKEAGIIESDEEVGDIKDRVKFANLVGLSWRRNPLDKEIKNYERAYKLYKSNFLIREITITPTVKTADLITIPTDNFFSELDLLDTSKEIHHQLIKNGLVKNNSKYGVITLISPSPDIKLDLFDEIVYIVVCNLYKQNNPIITINDIYKEMTLSKKARVQKTMEDDINNSMDKLKTIRISLQNPLHDLEGKLRPEDDLLNFKKVETIGKKPGTLTVSYYIKEEPYYIKAMKLIKWQRDLKKINLDIKQNKKIILLEWVIMLELAERSNMLKKAGDNLKMNIDNILERIGVKNTGDNNKYRKDRRRYIDITEDFLTAHIKAGNIKSYTPYKDKKNKIIGYCIKIQADKTAEINI